MHCLWSKSKAATFAFQGFQYASLGQGSQDTCNARLGNVNRMGYIPTKNGNANSCIHQK